MDTFYTSERNHQILIALMKAHNIRKVVASPGTTNISLVGSLQQDPFFEMYSSADERSAAYMACGIAAETGEPVALSCTGATASRNYIPALTEAFYRKLPVLAITSTQPTGRVGNHVPQVIDRQTPLNDIVNFSVQIPAVHDEEDAWACGVQINKALLELRHRGGGPVHINLTTMYGRDFSVKELPEVKVIRRITSRDVLPELKAGKIGIIVGSHAKWSSSLTDSVDRFCGTYNAVVLCDHTSNYKGSYGVLAALVDTQAQGDATFRHMDILIHIGEVSGAYLSGRADQVWRVNPDGEIRDTYRKLRYVFEMEEEDFFNAYTEKGSGKYEAGLRSFADEWQQEYQSLLDKMPDMPFSNIWMARTTAGRLPENAVLHLGILNSLRAWNFFRIPQGVMGYSNTGGFGIDGNLSSLIGAAIAAPNKLFFGIVGDLAFFYDMNSLGNRHVGRNIRILLVNNGRGTEFRNYSHTAQQLFHEDADAYMAAAGHYGNQSGCLVRHYAEDLGFEYLSASTKEEYINNLDHFLSAEITERSMLFEVFTGYRDESEALEIVHNIEKSMTGTAKKVAKDILGENGIRTIKKFIGRG